MWHPKTIGVREVDWVAVRIGVERECLPRAREVRNVIRSRKEGFRREVARHRWGVPLGLSDHG